MLQKNFFPKFRQTNYIYYLHNNIIILEQGIKKNYKIYFCKFNFLHHKYSYFFQEIIIFYLNSLIIIWLKLIFRGKGYRMRKFKKANKLTFNFGRSHWTKYSYDQKLFFTKKFRRQKIMCLVRFFSDVSNFWNVLKSVKPLNMYTKRGLRWKKQKISRRFGKISQVVSSLH